MGVGRVWVWLSVPVVVLLALAAARGCFDPGLYRDAPAFAAQAVAQDWVTLFIVVPVTALSAWFTARGSSRARLVWLGSLVYTVYSYVIYALVVRYNPLFLVYIALLGCALYALIGGLATTDMRTIATGFAGRAPVRSVSAFLALLALMFYALWLKEALPAVVAGHVPLSVQQNGTPTNAVHVLDMAWVLPAFLLTAVNLSRKVPLGYTLAGVALTFIVLLVLAVVSIGVFMAAVPEIAIFGTIAVLGGLLCVWYLRALRT